LVYLLPDFGRHVYVLWFTCSQRLLNDSFPIF
jgi:hypothetical protein